jgi:ABC-type long-subunit fatty acid transport system fused permease/ATPase subunit
LPVANAHSTGEHMSSQSRLILYALYPTVCLELFAAVWAHSKRHELQNVEFISHVHEQH